MWIFICLSNILNLPLIYLASGQHVGGVQALAVRGNGWLAQPRVWVITFFKPLRHCWYPSKSDGAIKWSPQMTVVSTTCFQSFWVDDTNLSHFFLTARSDGNSCRQELLLVLLHPPTTHLRTTFSCVLDVTSDTIYGGAIYGTSQKFNRLQFSYFKQTKHCKYLVFICYILKELTNKYIYY